MQIKQLGSLPRRALIFGGPYSNLAATAAMRRRAEQLGFKPDEVICTGDLVAYCAEPAATLDLIRDWGIHVVMGNCEESLGFSEADCGCGFDEGSSCSTLAVAWYRYADQRVSAAQRRWMQQLPRQLEFELGGKSFRVVHGSLSSINEFVFASSDDERKRAQIAEAGVDAIVGGHSGIPFGQRLDNRFWLNAGVIGMPANDGETRGWYMTIEAGEAGIEIDWHRLEYDYQSSHESTLAAGMTEYGQALRDGLWPSMDILPAAERAQQGQPLNLTPIRF